MSASTGLDFLRREQRQNETARCAFYQVPSRKMYIWKRAVFYSLSKIYWSQVAILDCNSQRGRWILTHCSQALPVAANLLASLVSSLFVPRGLKRTSHTRLKTGTSCKSLVCFFSTFWICISDLPFRNQLDKGAVWCITTYAFFRQW